jgi:hypothetical protein
MFNYRQTSALRGKREFSILPDAKRFCPLPTQGYQH